MTFLGLEVRTDLPQVSYPTAIDYYVFVSFMFIFFAVVQVNMILMIYHDDISNDSVIILCLNFFATFILTLYHLYHFRLRLFTISPNLEQVILITGITIIC